MLSYVQSQSTTKPPLIEVGSGGAYLRRNITETVDSSGDIPVTFYNYEEARLTIEEFNTYANETLMAGQENSNLNQLTIMEAFADMYEMMAMSN